MNLAIESLSKRYACAFYKVFKAFVTPEEIGHLQQLSQFFTTNKLILLALCNSAYNQPASSQALALLAQQFKLPPPTTTLIEILMERNSICLLPGIIRHLQQLYDKQQGNVVYTVSSSHPLQEEQKKIILHFIQQTHKDSTVVTHFKLAPELISGLRIASNELLWERSIRKVFSHLKHRWVART